MRIVITGGHLNPALCVIDELPKDVEVLMIGRKYGLEGEKILSLEYLTAKSLNIPFKSITTGRLQRRFTKHTITSLFKFPFGIFKSAFILKQFGPDVILTFGGYVALPVAIAGFILRIPVFAHEQTLEAGFSNRIISRFAKKVFISWESSRKYFPENKTVLTGNPIRKYQISNYSPEFKTKDIKYQISNEKLPLIYVTGGSSGSHAINILIEGCIEKLLNKYIVIHQTGDAREFMDFERLEKLKFTFPEKLQKRYVITKFVKPDEVFSVLDKASLVISRSGINTVTELIFFGKPSILIPLPYAQNDEQTKNARFLKSLGLGEIAGQGSLSSEKLFSLISDMFSKLKTYEENAVKVRHRLPSDAAARIVEIVLETVNKDKV